MICSTASGPGHGRSLSLSSYPGPRHTTDAPFKRKRAIEVADGERRNVEGAASQHLPLSSSGQSSSVSSSSALGAVRMASTVVTNVVRPVISTPVPIASKSFHERKLAAPQTQFFGATLAPAGAGTYYSSSSSIPPNAPGAQGGLNLVLGGTFQAPSAVQLITPPPPAQNAVCPVTMGTSQSNGPIPVPLLQPHILPTSSAQPTGQKAVTQVQYILPTLSVNHPKSSSPQQPVNSPTGVFTVPTAPPTIVTLANGKQSGYSSVPAVGVVSQATRGMEKSSSQ